MSTSDYMPEGPRARQGTLPEPELESLLGEMRRGTPWQEALERLQLPTLSGKRHWFTDLAKAQFYLGLPTPGHYRALDVGAGSGVIAAGMAAGGYQHVVALEHDAGWCEFMRRRYAEDRVGPVEVVQGSAVPTFPFDEASFDLVVVNGVLEWVPEAAPGTPPGRVQLEFLREARRILRPGGAIGIGIENRLFLGNLKGYGPHGEPPFAVLMPRRLADLYTRRRRGLPYRTWIYSWWGYRSLLRKAGFHDVRVMAVLPDYHTPRRVVPVSDSAAAREGFHVTRASRRLALKALAGAGVLGYLTHSFYIEAHA